MSKVDFKYDLGSKAKCLVTGIEGIIDSRSEWLNGCLRYSIQPHGTTADGAMKTGYWVDEKQVELIEKDALNIKKSNTGGPNTRSK